MDACSPHTIATCVGHLFEQPALSWPIPPIGVGLFVGLQISPTISENCNSEVLPLGDISPHVVQPRAPSSSVPRWSEEATCLIMWLVSWDVFIRSFCLMQLLAFMRLWLCAFKLQPKRPRVNQAVRLGRCSLRGAPLCLVLCLCVSTASAVRSHPYVGTRASSNIAQAEETGRRDDAPATVDLARSGSSGTDQRWVSASTRFFAGEVVDCTSDSLDDNWSFPVRILFYQSFALDTLFCAQEVDGVDDLVEVLEDRHDASGCQVAYLPITPQPTFDYVHLLAVPVFETGLPRIPVCFQLQTMRYPLRVWMDFCEVDFTVAQAHELAGQHWIPGSSVYVGFQTSPLAQDVSVRLVPGQLLRIVAPGCRELTPRTLEDKLRHPARSLRYTATCPLTDELRNRHQLGLAQPLCPLSVVQFDPNGAPDVTATEVAAQIVRDWGPVTLRRPPTAARDVSVRGEHVHSVVGLFPRDLHSRVPVFVDGRKIGLPYEIYASMSGNMTLREFLCQIGIVLSTLSFIYVTGTVGYDFRQQRVQVRKGDLAILHYSPLGAGHVWDPDHLPGGFLANPAGEVDHHAQADVSSPAGSSSRGAGGSRATCNAPDGTHGSNRRSANTRVRVCPAGLLLTSHAGASDGRTPTASFSSSILNCLSSGTRVSTKTCFSSTTQGTPLNSDVRFSTPSLWFFLLRLLDFQRRWRLPCCARPLWSFKRRTHRLLFSTP